MKYLADTHILLWAMENDLEQSRLPERAKQIFLDPDSEIYYSFINVWEVALKRTRHPEKIPYTARQFERLCRESGYVPLATDFKHAITAETLNYDRESAPQDHNDPFDRLLLAQAKSEDMLFLTHDHLIPFYHESCVVSV